MPLYDYDCADCGARFEVIHGVHADGPSACPTCGGGRVRKAIAAPAIHFKGSGWAKKERRAKAPAASSPDKEQPAGEAPAATPSGDGAAAAATPTAAPTSTSSTAGGD